MTGANWTLLFLFAGPLLTIEVMHSFGQVLDNGTIENVDTNSAVVIVEAQPGSDNEPNLMYFEQESEVPTNLLAAVHHTLLAFRWGAESYSLDKHPRIIVLRKDWNLDGIPDAAITIAAFCGMPCCIWNLYIATEGGEYRFLDMLSFGSEAPPEPIRNNHGLVELFAGVGCASHVIRQDHYIGSIETGLSLVESNVNNSGYTPVDYK